ncbi:unnamed protein product, partial [Prorocentrum cordatum]
SVLEWGPREARRTSPGGPEELPRPGRARGPPRSRSARLALADVLSAGSLGSPRWILLRPQAARGARAGHAQAGSLSGSP